MLPIPNDSVDLIFTDPPYKRKYLPLYEWLAEESARVLKPDGFLLAYVGVYWKDEVMALIRPHMSYYADLIMVNRGYSPMLWQRRLISRHRSCLAYSCHGRVPKPRTNVLTVWVGTGADKRYHTWGQDESSARYYIDCFSAMGDVVLDPFCGGGTTPAMCKVLGRNFLSFDNDPQAVQVARCRLKDAQPFFPGWNGEQLEFHLKEGNDGWDNLSDQV